MPVRLSLPQPVFSTHIQAMRGVEATPRQLLIAGRQVCSTVQGIHLVDTNAKTSTQSVYKVVRRRAARTWPGFVLSVYAAGNQPV